MVICVECQVVDGNGKAYTDDDDWTVRTENGVIVLCLSI
jgi:hypothetical protein